MSGCIIARSSLRSISGETNGGKRFMRTVQASTNNNNGGTNSDFTFKIDPVGNTPSSGGSRLNKWAAHGLAKPSEAPKKPQQSSFTTIEISQPKRRSRADKYKKPETESKVEAVTSASSETTSATASPASPATATDAAPAPKKKRILRPRKALITLSESAVEHLKALLDQPNPQMIRIGVRNRGCSGLTYHLEYVTEGGKFDELIEQDGVKVLIDSKALFSIVGSQMDWLDDKLSSRFIFKNPNSKGTCGCGESFMV